MTNQFDKDLMSTFQLQNENSSLKQGIENLERQLRYAITDKEKIVTVHRAAVAQHFKDNALLRLNLIQSKKDFSELKDKYDEKERILQTALVQMAIKSDEIKFTRQGHRLLQSNNNISSMIHPNNTSINSSKYGVREVMRQKAINDSLRQEIHKLVSSNCLELIELKGKTEELQVMADLANTRANEYEKELEQMKSKVSLLQEEKIQLQESIDTKLLSDLADYECKLHTKAIERDALMKKSDEKESHYITSLHAKVLSEVMLRQRVYELMSHLKLMRKNMIEVQIEMSCLLTVSTEECDQLKYDYAQITSEMDRIVAENQLLMETSLQQDQLLNLSTQAFSQYVSDHKTIASFSLSSSSLEQQQPSQFVESDSSTQPQQSVHDEKPLSRQLEVSDGQQQQQSQPQKIQNVAMNNQSSTPFPTDVIKVDNTNNDADVSSQNTSGSSTNNGNNSNRSTVPTLLLSNLSQSSSLAANHYQDRQPQPHASLNHLPSQLSQEHSSSSSFIHQQQQLADNNHVIHINTAAAVTNNNTASTTTQSERQVIESVWLNKLTRETQRHSDALRTAREVIHTAREETDAERVKRQALEAEVTQDTQLLMNQLHSMQMRVNSLVKENNVLQTMNTDLQNQINNNTAATRHQQQSLLLSSQQAPSISLSHSVSNSSFPSSSSTARSKISSVVGDDTIAAVAEDYNIAADSVAPSTESQKVMMISHQEHVHHIHLLNQKSKDIELHTHQLFKDQKQYVEKMKQEIIALKQENEQLQQMNEHQSAVTVVAVKDKEHHHHQQQQQQQQQQHEHHQQQHHQQQQHQQLDIAKMQIVSMKSQFEEIMIEKQQLQTQLQQLLQLSSVTLQQQLQQQEAAAVTRRETLLQQHDNPTLTQQLEEFKRNQQQSQLNNTLLTMKLQESITLNETLQLNISSLDKQLHESMDNKELLDLQVSSLTAQIEELKEEINKSNNQLLMVQQHELIEQEATKSQQQQRQQELLHSQLQVSALRTLLQETNASKEQLQTELSTLIVTTHTNQQQQLIADETQSAHQQQVTTLTHQLSESIKTIEQLQLLNSSLTIPLTALRGQQQQKQQSQESGSNDSSSRLNSAITAESNVSTSISPRFLQTAGSEYKHISQQQQSPQPQQQQRGEAVIVTATTEAEDKMTKLAIQIEQLQIKLKQAIDSSNSNSNSPPNTAHKRQQQRFNQSQGMYDDSNNDDEDEDDGNISYRGDNNNDDGLNISTRYSHSNNKTTNAATDWHERASQLYSSPYRHDHHHSSGARTANINDSITYGRDGYRHDDKRSVDFQYNNNDNNATYAKDGDNDQNDKQNCHLLIARCTALEEQIQSMPASLQIAQAERRVAEAKWHKAVSASEAQCREKERETDRVRQELQAFLAVQFSEKDALTQQVQQQAATIHQLTTHLRLLQSQQIARQV